MTPEEFIDTILKNPTLTIQGFDVTDGSEETFEDERGKLAECYDEANASEEYLKTQNRTEKPNKAAGTTKDIVHEVVRQSRCRRIREGALILAAIHLGFKMKHVRNRSSVYLNIE